MLLLYFLLELNIQAYSVRVPQLKIIRKTLCCEKFKEELYSSYM